MPAVNSKSLHASPGQLVKIPDQFKKHVRGPGGDNLRNVSTVTGAKVTQLGDQELYVRGEKKKVQHAEYLLRTRVVSPIQSYELPTLRKVKRLWQMSVPMFLSSLQDNDPSN